jgi:hypothetical protein
VALLESSPPLDSNAVSDQRDEAVRRVGWLSPGKSRFISSRVVNGKETMSFWDIERLRFTIERGPEWLSIDEATGLLSGAPDRAGKSEVVITTNLEREQQRLDEEALKWGIQKVVSTGTVTVGSAIQSFVIDVSL